MWSSVLFHSSWYSLMPSLKQVINYQELSNSAEISPRQRLPFCLKCQSWWRSETPHVFWHSQLCGPSAWGWFSGKRVDFNKQDAASPPAGLLLLLFAILQRQAPPYAHLPLSQVPNAWTSEWEAQEPAELKTGLALSLAGQQGKASTISWRMETLDPHATDMRTEFLFPLCPKQCQKQSENTALQSNLSIILWISNSWRFKINNNDTLQRWQVYNKVRFIHIFMNTSSFAPRERIIWKHLWRALKMPTSLVQSSKK